MGNTLRHTLLNLLRVAKNLAASTFIRKLTPAGAYPGIEPVVHSFESRVDTPELPAMKLYPAGRAFQSSQYHFPSCYGMVLPSVFYEPDQGLVLDRHRRAIEDLHQVPMRKHWYRWRPFLNSHSEDISGLSFAFRSFTDKYYHLITDHLPALYMLGKLDWGSDEEINFLHPGPLTATEEFFITRMCPEQVKMREIKPQRLYRLENYLYVSYLSRRSAGCLPPEYVEHFLGMFAPQRPRKRDKRIFISRAGSARRRILNEAELFEGLIPYGFESYLLEEMSAERQVELFYDAEMIVSPHGAGLVNLLFSERVKLLELFPGPLVRPHYYYICKSLRHDYRYLCSQEKYRFPGNILIDLEEGFNGSLADFSVNCKDVFRAVEEMDAQS